MSRQRHPNLPGSIAVAMVAKSVMKTMMHSALCRSANPVWTPHVSAGGVQRDAVPAPASRAPTKPITTMVRGEIEAHARGYGYPAAATTAGSSRSNSWHRHLPHEQGRERVDSAKSIGCGTHSETTRDSGCEEKPRATPSSAGRAIASVIVWTSGNAVHVHARRGRSSSMLEALQCAVSEHWWTVASHRTRLTVMWNSPRN